MPRLKFDLQPEGPWRAETVEEHNASLKEWTDQLDWMPDPAPCGCGLYIEGMHCTCRPEERRQRTPARVQQMLESRARRKHLEGLAEKRKFPPLPRCSYGTCYWCRLPIVHGRAKSRSMHDGRADEPDCRHEYNLRTRLESQQNHLLARDGKGCFTCDAMVGGWGPIWTDPSAERVAQTWASRAWIRERFKEQPAGPVTYITWTTGLEVDHFIALAVAWLAFPDPERRRWFFAPANLRLLCTDCHKAKTQEDRLLLRQAALFGADWLKTQVLHLLADAGLLATPKPKGAAECQDGSAST